MGGQGSGRPQKERPLEGQSKFVEEEKPAIATPKAFPKKDRIKCKVFNLEVDGEDIVGKVNGVNFSVQHGQEFALHPSQIEVLQNALIETEEWTDLGDNWVKRPLVKPRFMVQVLSPAM